MKLKSLSSFEIINNISTQVIIGGRAFDSRKGDVNSTSKDSKKDDGKPKKESK